MLNKNVEINFCNKSNSFIKKILENTTSGQNQNNKEINPNPFISKNILLDIIAVSDIVILIFSALISNYLYLKLFLNLPDDTSILTLPILCCVLFFYIIMKKNNSYNIDNIINHKKKNKLLFYNIIAAFSCVFIILFLTKTSEVYSRGWFATWFLIFLTLIFLSRIFIIKYIKTCIANGRFQKRIALIGMDYTLENALSHFTTDNYQFRLVSLHNLISNNENINLENHETIQICHDFIEILHQGKMDQLDQIIVALPGAEKELLQQIVRTLRLLPVDIQIVPDFASVEIPLVDMEPVGSLKVINIDKKPISDWGFFLKRVSDIFLASIALVIFAPAMLLISLVISNTSSGPILFKQKRHGYNHRIIEVLKFRTMRVCENGDTIKQAQKSDDRITPIGHFLRRTSLDELPQLINVLKGEMSIVGPRPHAAAHNSYYSEFIENYANRHRVKPGITGLAQINGLRGGTEDPSLMEQRIQLDLQYIENWSIWLDIKIILLTPIYGFINKNAY